MSSTQRVTIRVPESLYVQIAALAKIQKKTISDLARDLIELGLTRDDRAPLTKTDLLSLERLSVSVFLTEQLVRAALDPKRELLTEASKTACMMSNELLGTRRGSSPVTASSSPTVTANSGALNQGTKP